MRAVNCRVSEDTTAELSEVILTVTDELTAWPRQKLDTNVKASASTAYTRGECDLMINNLDFFRNTGKPPEDPTAIYRRIAQTQPAQPNLSAGE
jgi:hypothetical protein